MFRKTYTRDNYQPDYWSNYTRIIKHPSFKCCGEPTFLVRTSKGGFVKHICIVCKKTFRLNERDFEKLEYDVFCPGCNNVMEKAKIIYSNYGFYCEQCGASVALSEFLHYKDDLESGIKKTINICLSCGKFHTDTCPGPNKFIGSFERLGYYCGSYTM